MKLHHAPVLAFGLLALLCGPGAGQEASPPVVIVDDGRALTIKTPAGDAFTVYHYRLPHRPVFHPLHGPDGASLLRSWPLGPDRDGEEKDHVHHKGMWFTHGSVNGVDFWLDDRGPGNRRGGRIIHQEFVDPSKFGEGVVTSRNRWVAPSGQVVCSDVRRHAFLVLADRREIDVTVKILADQRDVVIGDTKEGTFALRLHPALRARGGIAKGKMVNADGVKGRDVWGKQSAWVAYSGPVDGHDIGVAIFDHPKNLRHPTYWHARDYGLFAANPFGVHDFTRKPAGAGDHRLAKGESLTLHYRVVMFRGDPSSAKLSERYAEFSATPVPTLP